MKSTIIMIRLSMRKNRKMRSKMEGNCLFTVTNFQLHLFWLIIFVFVNYSYDEYYQDGYFWNGTEWVVADEVHGENDGTVDGYEENNVEEEIPPENQQSALSLFGGGDVLGKGILSDIQTRDLF